MPDLHFTTTAIKALPSPDTGKRVWYHDLGTPYLALRVFSTGKKAFYHYRWIAGKPQQTKLGDWPEMRLEQAQRAVARLNGAIADGANPQAGREAQRGEWTFEQLLAWYEKQHASKKKSGARDRRQLELYFPELFPLKVSTIKRPLIRELHNRCGASPDPRVINKPRTYSANRALAALHCVFARAIEYEKFDGHNPADGIRHHPETSRERRLHAHEIARFLDAVEAAPIDMHDYVLISLMTGARKSNVLAMRWQDIDFNLNVWRIPETKNGRPLLVPLEHQELEILTRRRQTVDGPWVFPGRSDGRTGHLSNPKRGWKNILDAAQLEDFRLHDLRRTLGSLMADAGASLPIIGKALGHQSQAATAIYARLSLDPVRDAKAKALTTIARVRRGEG